MWVLPAIPNELPLACTSDQDKLVVAYDTNKIAVFNLIGKKLYDWTKENLEKFPGNYLNRFNRIIGISQIDDQKFILYTNYTYITLDLS